MRTCGSLKLVNPAHACNKASSSQLASRLTGALHSWTVQSKLDFLTCWCRLSIECIKGADQTGRNFTSHLRLSRPLRHAANEPCATSSPREPREAPPELWGFLLPSSQLARTSVVAVVIFTAPRGVRGILRPQDPCPV